MTYDELLRLRGEQVTLQKEQRELAGQIEGERAALQSLVNRIRPMPGVKADWLDAEVARLRRLDEQLRRFGENSARLAELERVTGL